MLFLPTALVALCLPSVFAIPAPTGWSAGPAEYLGQPGDATFDYVVVGGGTAGLTVAHRLAEDRRLKIAVIEAGDFYEIVNGNLSVVPGYAGAVSTPAVDWGFQTTEQAALGGRKLEYRRGRTVGGSSATNLLGYHRGTVGSYDRWAKAVGDESFTFKNLLPYFRKSVKYTPPNMSIRANNASVPKPHPDSYDASGGPLDVTHTNWGDVVSSYGAPAFKEIGNMEIDDLSAGALIGNQYSAATVRPSDQTRSSSESSFWQASVKSGRRNLKLYTKSMAKKILFNDKKAATGVSVQTGGTTYTLKAKKEVILSAGAMQSPQMLMVSGIGPAAALKKLNIPVVVDSPAVGQNMQDHMFFGFIHQVSVLTKASTLSEPFGTQAVNEYNNKRTGILASTGADYFAWEKVPQNLRSALPDATKTHLSTYPGDWPDIEMVLGDLPFQAGADYVEIIGMLQVPEERGIITISSPDTKDPPVINTNTFSTPADQAVVMALFKRIRALTATKAFAPIMGPEILPGADVQSDEQIMQWLKDNVGPGYHAACTCAMGKKGDKSAVVDTKGRVFGAQRLRVIDASVFPLLPPGHLLATVYAVAEKLADDIKNDIKGGY